MNAGDNNRKDRVDKDIRFNKINGWNIFPQVMRPGPVVINSIKIPL
jgi:hypothetical protein